MAYTIEFAALELLWSRPEIRGRALQALQSIHESQSVNDEDRRTLDLLVGSITQFGDIDFERRKSDFVARGQIDTGDAVLREILLNSMQAYRKASASGQSSGEQIIDIQWQQRSNGLYDVTVTDAALQGNMTLPRILTEYFGAGVSEKRDDASESAGHGIGAKNQLGWALNGSVEAEGTKVSYSRNKEASEPYWRYHFEIGEKSSVNRGMKVTMQGLQLSSDPRYILENLLLSFDNPTFTVLANGKNIFDNNSYTARMLQPHQDAKAKHSHVTRQVYIIQNGKRVPVYLDIWVGDRYEPGRIRVVQNEVVEYKSDLWRVGLKGFGNLQLNVETTAMLPRAKSSLGALQDVLEREAKQMPLKLARKIEENFPNTSTAEFEAYERIKAAAKERHAKRHAKNNLKNYGLLGRVAKYGMVIAPMVTAAMLTAGGIFLAGTLYFFVPRPSGTGINLPIGIEGSAFSDSQSTKPSVDDLGRLGISPSGIKFWYSQIGQQNSIQYFMVNSFDTLGLKEWSNSEKNKQVYRPVFLQSPQFERYDHVTVTIPVASTKDKQIKLPIVPGGQLDGRIYTSEQDLRITKMEATEAGEVYVHFNKDFNGTAIFYGMVVDKQRQIPELSAAQVEKYIQMPADIKLDLKVQEIIDSTRGMEQFERAQEIVRRLGNIFVYDTSKKTENAYKNSNNTLETLLHGDSNIAPFFGDCDVHNMGAAYVLRMIGVPTIAAVGYVGINNVATNASGHGYLLSWFKDKGWVVFDATGAQVLETSNAAVLVQSLKNAVFSKMSGENILYGANYDPNAISIDRQESNGLGTAKKALAAGLIALAAAGAGYYLYRTHRNKNSKALKFAYFGSQPLESRRVIPAYLVEAGMGGVAVQRKKVSLADTLTHSMRGSLFAGNPPAQDPAIGCYIPDKDHADLAKSFGYRRSSEIASNPQDRPEILEPYQGEHYIAIEAATRAIMSEIEKGTDVGWQNLERVMEKLKLGPKYLQTPTLPGTTRLVSENSLNTDIAEVIITGRPFKPNDISFIAKGILSQANHVVLFPAFNDYAFGAGGVTQKINYAAKR